MMLIEHEILYCGQVYNQSPSARICLPFLISQASFLKKPSNSSPSAERRRHCILYPLWVNDCQNWLFRMSSLQVRHRRHHSLTGLSELTWKLARWRPSLLLPYYIRGRWQEDPFWLGRKEDEPNWRICDSLTCTIHHRLLSSERVRPTVQVSISTIVYQTTRTTRRKLHIRRAREQFTLIAVHLSHTCKQPIADRHNLHQ